MILDIIYQTCFKNTENAKITKTVTNKYINDSKAKIMENGSNNTGFENQVFSKPGQHGPWIIRVVAIDSGVDQDKDNYKDNDSVFVMTKTKT